MDGNPTYHALALTHDGGKARLWAQYGGTMERGQDSPQCHEGGLTSGNISHSPAGGTPSWTILAKASSFELILRRARSAASGLSSK